MASATGLESFEERIRRRTEEAAGSRSTRSDGRNLLGFDNPINSISKAWYNDGHGTPRARFPNAISDWRATPRTLRERAMLALMNAPTDKAEWTRKIRDETIVAKWRVEAEVDGASTQQERAVTAKMFDYTECIEELREVAKTCEEVGFVPAIDADAIVYKSDSVIPDALRERLRTAAAALENVPERLRDWHPGSDEQVLDLVHPSLFPLLYGRSTILPEGNVPREGCEKFVGQGVVVPVPAAEDLEVSSEFDMIVFPGGFRRRQHYYSAKFQWLPCEVSFAGEEATKITSYINNLHPHEHRPLYEAIEEIIARAIPMWDATLASVDKGRLAEVKPRIKLQEAGYIESTETRPRAANESELDEDQIMELDENWRRAQRVLIMPEPEQYGEQKRSPYPVLGEGDAFRSRAKAKHTTPEKIGLRSLFSAQGLQVIVKLANIHLTPDRPRYPGGSWHVEGQLNEHICASALFYYDSCNISDSALSFREATDSETMLHAPYQQDDYAHLERLYGIRQGHAAIQDLGSVRTVQGRMVTFANVLQHRVEGFALQDASREGHRKLLALFLVDPYTRIPSTQNVPPQQREWWRKMVLGVERVGNLPPELAERVVESGGPDLPISLDEAKQLRLELMEERKMFVEQVDSQYRHDTFNFCEH